MLTPDEQKELDRINATHNIFISDADIETYRTLTAKKSQREPVASIPPVEAKEDLCPQCGNPKDDPRPDSIERMLVCGSSFHVDSTQIAEVKEGTWPAHCPQRAFVEGMKWWQWQRHGATAFRSEVDEAEAEAVKRYGDPTRVAEAKPSPDMDAAFEEWRCSPNTLPIFGGYAPSIQKLMEIAAKSAWNALIKKAETR